MDFEITEKGELFRGTEVSRKSVASEVVELLLDPDSARTVVFRKVLLVACGLRGHSTSFGGSVHISVLTMFIY